MSREPRPGVPDAGYLGEALRLNQRLNLLRTTAGQRLSGLIESDGFEPWWFLQEQVMWKLLVPFTHHRRLFHQLLDADPPGDLELPPDVAIALQLLAPELAVATGHGGHRPRAVSSKALTRLSRAGLALVSLASLLLFRWRRKTTLLYILEQVSPGLRHDFRLDPIYREMRARGYRFGEYPHLQGPREGYRGAWRNLLRRRRPVVFFEVLADLGRRLRRRPPAPAITIDLPAADLEDRFLAAVAQWTIRQSHSLAQALPTLTAILRFQKLERAIVLDDSRHANLLVAACRAAGVPTLGYMHGLFNRYHTGLMAFGFAGARRHTPDLYIVWSEYFRQRLLAGDLFDEAGTAACGPLRAPPGNSGATQSARPAGGPIRVLVVSEPRAAQEEVGSYLEPLLADPRFRVSIKVRPGEAQPHAAAAVGTTRLEIIDTGTVYEAFTEADVVIGTYSSVLYEAAMALLPVVVLSTSFTYGHDIAEDGLADFATEPGQVCEVVAAAAALDTAELTRRRLALWGASPGDGAQNLFDLAETKLWRPPGKPVDRTRSGQGPRL